MTNASAEYWEIYDRYGNKIYMTAERWQHALESRPWLADYHNEVLMTIQRGRRKQDPLKPHKYKYYRHCDDLSTAQFQSFSRCRPVWRKN